MCHSIVLFHRAIHRESTRCLQLLLQPDRTYFKDHKGRTVFHLTVEKGAIEACELILKMRVDAIFDTDKTVSLERFVFRGSYC